MKTYTRLIVLLVVLIFSCDTENTDYDLLIRNGIVYDGSGKEGVKADIGIVADTIVAIGDLAVHTSKREIDAMEWAVSPGFIDLHAHLDPIMQLSNCESAIRQGVTTSLGGPDGSSPWPLGAYLDSLKKIGVGMNVGYLIGHNTVRKNIMQLENRPPTEDELEQMKEQIHQAMEEGAFGISTGLKYLPGAFSKTDEIISLSKVVAENGGFYTSHLREEGLGLIEGVKEAIVIGKEAHIGVVLTHHKVIGKPMWGASTETLALIEAARQRGQDVMADQYPYAASHTGIGVLIPAWSRSGGQQKFKERVSDSTLRDSIKKQIVFSIMNDRGGGDLRRIQFASVSWNKALEGKTLYDWCIMQGMEPTVENGADLVIQAQLNGKTSCIYHVMDEDDVRRIMQYPHTAIASDGRLTKPGIGHPHPRWYGTFPRVLEKYVRQDSILSLSEAIRKMTALPAERMGLKNRGLLKAGYQADIVIFDPQRIKENTTFEDPHQYPTGIHYVFVNGKLAVEKGQFLNKKYGEVLTRMQ